MVKIKIKRSSSLIYSAKWLLALVFLFILACGGALHAEDKDKAADKDKDKEKTTVYYIKEEDLPNLVAVVPAFNLSQGDLDAAIMPMINSVTRNYVASKGFRVLPPQKVDAKLEGLNSASFNPDEVFKKVPEATGLFTVSVYEFTTVNMAFVEWYKLDAEICLYGKKKKMGCWRDNATRKKLAIATDPISAIATLVSSAVSSSAQSNIKSTIFDWAYKISNYLPGFSEGSKIPKILRVVTNVTEKPFKLGDKIAVGIEGDRGLSATFDIGQYKKDITMSESEPGFYKGIYSIQEGEKVNGEVLFVHLTSTGGNKRDWVETWPFITIDAVPPQKPQSLSAEKGDKSIRLTWITQDAKTVEFVLFRSENPLSDYVEIARVKNFNYEDPTALAAKSYYYRLSALDKVGNVSPEIQYGPVALAALTDTPLPANLSGVYPSGRYLLNKPALLPYGMKVQIGPDALINCTGEGKITVEGELVLQKVILKGDGKGCGGIEVASTGKLSWEGGDMDAVMKPVTLKGAASIKGINVRNSKSGILINSSGRVEIRDTVFMGLEGAVRHENGELLVEGARFEKNKLAVEVINGVVSISRNNFLGNTLNVRSDVPVTLRGNYMGGTDAGAFLIGGKVEVKTVLNAPYPDGKEVEIDPQAMAKKAEEFKNIGIKAIKEGKYGEAYENLEKSLKIQPDKDAYLYFVLTLTYMKEDEKLKSTVEQALNKFPYEVRIYKQALRYYLQTQKKAEAKDILERGLRLNPGNPDLEAMKPLVDGMK
jgi:hypothetical protein